MITPPLKRFNQPELRMETIMADLAKAIQEIMNQDHWEQGFHRTYICPSCMNEFLDNRDQFVQVDWGSVRVLDEKFHTCALVSYTYHRD